MKLSGLTAPKDLAIWFGDVRALVHGPPSAQAWRELTERLVAWPDARERDEQLLPYVRAHVHSWPDALRVAPWPWLAAIIERQRCPCFELVRAVDADQRVHRFTIKRLARRPALSRVTHLTLQSNELDAAMLRHVLSSPYLMQLRALTIMHNALGARGLSPLQAVSLGWRLTSLRLQHVELDRRAAYELSRAHLMLERLEALSLSMNPLGAEGVRALLGAGALPALRELELSHCHLHDEGARTLLAWRATPALRALDLSCNGMSEARTLEALARSALLTQLEALSLGSNFWRGDTLALILRDAPAHAMQRLNLASVGLGPTSTALLVDSPWVTSLKMLSLERNGLGYEGVVALAGPRWAQLEALDLSGVSMTDDALAAFAEQAQMPALRRLRLDKNRLKGPGLAALARAPGLPSLSQISAASNPVEPDARADLDPRILWA